MIVSDEGMYDKMEEPSDDENDMLDLAFGLTETSRLGCQVVMSKELDGLVVSLCSYVAAIVVARGFGSSLLVRIHAAWVGDVGLMVDAG